MTFDKWQRKGKGLAITLFFQVLYLTIASPFIIMYYIGTGFAKVGEVGALFFRNHFWDWNYGIYKRQNAKGE